jgi:hypothetical protein
MVTQREGCSEVTELDAEARGLLNRTDLMDSETGAGNDFCFRMHQFPLPRTR